MLQSAKTRLCDFQYGLRKVSISSLVQLAKAGTGQQTEVNAKPSNFFVRGAMQVASTTGTTSKESGLGKKAGTVRAIGESSSVKQLEGQVKSLQVHSMRMRPSSAYVLSVLVCTVLIETDRIRKRRC